MSTLLPPPATANLVLGAQRGDKGAFAELVRSHMRPAYAIALSVVGREADAEDVAQDALIAALEHLDACRNPALFTAWLFQIVRNHARNWLAKRRLRDVPAQAETREQVAHETSAETRSMAEHLLESLKLLSHEQREVVLLHDLEGWTHAEIAASLSISEIMSRQHLYVARQKLRATFSENFKTPEELQ